VRGRLLVSRPLTGSELLAKCDREIEAHLLRDPNRDLFHSGISGMQAHMARQSKRSRDWQEKMWRLHDLRRKIEERIAAEALPPAPPAPAPPTRPKRARKPGPSGAQRFLDRTQEEGERARPLSQAEYAARLAHLGRPIREAGGLRLACPACQSTIHSARECERQPNPGKPLEPRGSCYLDAYKKSQAVGGTLVHGSVPYARAAGGRIPHAWVQVGTMIWEPQSGRTFALRDFDGIPLASYTAAEAKANLTATRHYGPWSQQVVALGARAGVYSEAEMRAPARRPVAGRSQRGKPCSCGRPVTPDGEGAAYGTCEDCWEAQGLENEHQDGGHADGPRGGCTMCRKTNPRGFSPEENRVRRDSRGKFWLRSFGSTETFPSPFGTKREALERARANEATARERGATDADEARAQAALAPPPTRPRRTVKLSSLLDRAPPGSWGEVDRVKNPRHPVRPTPISEARLCAELGVMLGKARLPGSSATVSIGPPDASHMDRRHARSCRSYAECDPRRLAFFFARAVLSLPDSNRRALLAHEVGHAMTPGGTEGDADRAAEKLLGRRIAYDMRWPGRAADGQRGLQAVGRRIR
jgi:hypothetical protein